MHSSGRSTRWCDARTVPAGDRLHSGIGDRLLRNTQTGPDGLIYPLTDAPAAYGALLRLESAPVDGGLNAAFRGDRARSSIFRVDGNIVVASASPPGPTPFEMTGISESGQELSGGYGAEPCQISHLGRGDSFPPAAPVENERLMPSGGAKGGAPMRESAACRIGEPKCFGVMSGDSMHRCDYGHRIARPQTCVRQPSDRFLAFRR